jgi:ABC-type antimicrobial peptide transport system permease subunit
MKYLSILRPNIVKIVITITGVLLSLFIVTNRIAISKVTWDEKRGVPIPFLYLTEYRGPCTYDNKFCSYYIYNSIQPLGIIINIIAIYIISCLVAAIIRRIILKYNYLYK